MKAKTEEYQGERGHDRDEVPAGLRGGEQEPAQAHGHRAAHRLNDGAPAERSLKRFRRAERNARVGTFRVFRAGWRGRG